MSYIEPINLPDNRDANLTHLRHYYEKHGAERTQGYIDALQTMAEQIDEIFYTPHEFGTFGRTPTRIKNGIAKIHAENLGLLEKVPNVFPELKAPSPL